MHDLKILGYQYFIEITHRITFLSAFPLFNKAQIYRELPKDFGKMAKTQGKLVPTFHR